MALLTSDSLREVEASSSYSSKEKSRPNGRLFSLVGVRGLDSLMFARQRASTLAQPSNDSSTCHRHVSPTVQVFTQTNKKRPDKLIVLYWSG